MKMTLDEYIRKIDRILQVKCGFGSPDLADYDFVSAYEDGETPSNVAKCRGGLTPSSVAKQMLENEGFSM